VLVAFACGFVAYAVLIASFSGRSQTYTSVHIGAWYRVKDAAMERTAPPRVIFIGGSNALYGMSAAVLQDATGVSAVNAGTHGALHYRHYFEWIKDHAKSGDLVVLSLEYSHFLRSIPSAIAVNYALNVAPQIVRRIPIWLAMYAILGADLRELNSESRRNAAASWRKGIQAHVDETVAASISSEGDYSHHTKASQTAEQKDMVNRQEPIEALCRAVRINQDIGDALRDLKAWCDAHEVRVVAAFPATIDFAGYHTNQAREARQVFERVYAMAGIPTVQTVQEPFRPADDFYDSPYHLTEEAMRARTLQLLPALRKWLPPAAAAGAKQ